MPLDNSFPLSQLSKVSERVLEIHLELLDTKSKLNDIYKDICELQRFTEQLINDDDLRESYVSSKPELSKNWEKLKKEIEQKHKEIQELISEFDNMFINSF
ncbi:hypothetical protein [Deltalipothrixvirus pozzuoliense]|uniref:Uncharacterized protein ORF100a n=1 Tax=Acidianus filamentous virus 2 (isolate Italy/Pozzuoli) TaxID=654910 RepID=Y100A_AFV2P|nr:hypothetical protein AFV2_gp26 [Acidianus filamentous virus 2]Q573E3.1 RecName: Full=Uncharacterized protein ORF100a [Acidianus filamentous virus 2 (isolate Pozzuoli)]CAH69413.1 hypothetical protein [Acidianus filamentous virus 2]